MNESSKVTVYYNKVFKGNEPELLRRLIKLWKENKINLINMEEKLATSEEVWSFIRSVDDLEECIQRLKWNEVADETMSVLIYLIRKNPSSILKSCIATWKYGKEKRNWTVTSKKEIENLLNSIEENKHE